MSKYKTDPEAATALNRYHEAKKRHPDMLLLLRVSDFYEAYSEDALILAKLTPEISTTLMPVAFSKELK